MSPEPRRPGGELHRPGPDPAHLRACETWGGGREPRPTSTLLSTSGVLKQMLSQLDSTPAHWGLPHSHTGFLTCQRPPYPGMAGDEGTEDGAG